MAFNDANIIVGAANVFVGPAATGSGRPALPVLASGDLNAASVSAGWRHVGYTTEGVEVSYEPDYGDVEVDKLLDSARIFKQGMRVTANTTFSEATLENLLVAWGQVNAGTGQNATGANPSVDILSGRLGEAPAERQLFFAGPRPGSAAGERQYHLWRAIQTESTSHALRRAEATTLPASFRCLPKAGVGSAGSAYGTITDTATRAFLDVGMSA